MKYAASLLAIAGLALALVLFAHENVAAIAALVIAAGPGLLLAASFHLVPMIANGYAWRQLLPPPLRPSAAIVTHAIWIRESVNGLLPVARVGGEVVAYRILR